MNYRTYLAICETFGYHGERRDQLARTAMLPHLRFNKGNPYMLPNLRKIDVFVAHPGLLRVPYRVLARWATRAIRETLPRRKLLKGPRLVAFRRRTMFQRMS